MGGPIINTFLVILLVGSLILMGFIHLANPWKFNKKGNAHFGFLLVLWASFWMEELLSLMGIDAQSAYWLFPVHCIQIIIAPLLYFSSVFYSRPNYHYSLKDSKHLFIPILYTCVLWYSTYVNPQSVALFILIMIIITTQVLFYSVLAYIEIRHHRKQLLRFASNNQGIDLDWLEFILVQFIVTTVIVILHNLFFHDRQPGIIINGVNVVASYFVAYFSLRQKEIFPIKKGRENELDYLSNDEEEPSKRKLISDQDLISIKSKLVNLMDIEKLYLDNDLNLVKLADRLEISPHHLSYAINKGFGLNFFQFVNHYRVDKAMELLSEPYKDLTILAIAFESGFNSKTSFNTTFKKLTGQTPSEYKNKQSSTKKGGSDL